MKYEYKHERIQARVEKEVWERGRHSKRQVYSEQAVQETLNRLGADGWELVSMDPVSIDPEWLYRTSSRVFDSAESEVIECWYATFKRPLEE